MVYAYHSIFCAYGFWLPNDPRGSWSEFVASWELVLAGGNATTITTRRSVAHTAHDVEARLAAKNALKFPPVVFDGLQARAIARGFAQAAADGPYRVLACSILPEHIHAVVARHARDIETIVGHLKSAATRQLREEALDPMAGKFRPDGRPASPWGENAWHVYLNSDDDIARAVRYVRQNPVKEGKRPQAWSFVFPPNPTPPRV